MRLDFLTDDEIQDLELLAKRTKHTKLESYLHEKIREIIHKEMVELGRMYLYLNEDKANREE